MRIIDERKPKTNLFKEVQVSQVFYVEDEKEYGENPYMKIFAIEDSDENYLNAIDLQGAQLIYINEDEPVILCSAVLKIY